MTEIYEYAVSLSGTTTQPAVGLPSFQPIKFLYATWLVDYGLCAQAFAYLEQIAALVCRAPQIYHPTLVFRLTDLALRLQMHDQQRLNYLEEGNQLFCQHVMYKSVLFSNCA